MFTKVTHFKLSDLCLAVNLIQQQVIYQIYTDQKLITNTHCNSLKHYISHSTKVSLPNSLFVFVGLVDKIRFLPKIL